MEIKHCVYNWHIGQTEYNQKKALFFSNPYVQYDFEASFQIARNTSVRSYSFTVIVNDQNESYTGEWGKGQKRKQFRQLLITPVLSKSKFHVYIQLTVFFPLHFGVELCVWKPQWGREWDSVFSSPTLYFPGSMQGKGI